MKFPMSGDRIVGDAGNTTAYERPDGSWYALDRDGRGCEFGKRGFTGMDPTPIHGPAKFDSRHKANGNWAGSQSTPG